MRQGPRSARQTTAPRSPGEGAGAGPHTDGAVLAIPARAALALAVPAGPMLGAARVAGALVAGRPHPAVLTAAGAPHADAVATTVGRTDLWVGGGRRGREKRQVLSQSFLGTRVTRSVSSRDSRGSGG